MSRYRIIHSAEIPDFAAPDPKELEVRWTMLKVPKAVIDRHINHLQEQHARKVEREKQAEAERQRKKQEHEQFVSGGSALRNRMNLKNYTRNISVVDMPKDAERSTRKVSR